jgi:hypothetical protein
MLDMHSLVQDKKGKQRRNMFKLLPGKQDVLVY